MLKAGAWLARRPGRRTRSSGVRHERRSTASVRMRRGRTRVPPVAAGAAGWSGVPRKFARAWTRRIRRSVGVGSRGARRGDGRGVDPGAAGAPVGARLAASERGGGVSDGSAERGTNQGERLRGYDPAVQGAGSRLEPLRRRGARGSLVGLYRLGRSAKPRFCRTRVESGAPHGPSLQAGSVEVR
jgi:hypothetical protein